MIFTMSSCISVFINLFAAVEPSTYICVVNGTLCNETILSVINQMGKNGNFGLFRPNGWQPLAEP